MFYRYNKMPSLIEITASDFSLYQKDILYIERVSFSDPWTCQQFKGEIHNPFSHLLVLSEDKRVVAYICFWLITDELHLMNIAVHPDKRNMGLGTYLLHAMLDRGAKHNAKTVWLEVRPSNCQAIKMYKKAGFVEVGRRPNYYSDTKEDAIIMALLLQP